MSTKQRIIAIIVVLLLYGSYLGYNSFMDHVHEQNIARCVDVAKDNHSFIQGDLESFCSCQVEVVKGQFHVDKTSPEFIENFADRFGYCVSEHLKKNKIRSCEEFFPVTGNSQVVNDIMRQTDCTCAIDAMLPFIVTSMKTSKEFNIGAMVSLDILERCRKKDG